MAISARAATPTPFAGGMPAPLVAIQRVAFHLGGLRKESDAMAVALRLRQAPGVLDAVVSPVTEIAYIAYDIARTDAASLRARIAATGHGPVTRWRP